MISIFRIEVDEISIHIEIAMNRQGFLTQTLHIYLLLLVHKVVLGSKG